MTIQELLAELSDKIGIHGDLSVKSMTDELPEDFVNAYRKAELMDITAALNHPKAKSKFTRSALDPIDQDIEAALDEYNFPDDVREELRKEKSTYQKLKTFRVKLAELERAKAAAGGTDKEALKNEIKKLREQMVATEDKYKREIDELRKQEDGRMLDYALNSYLSSLKYQNEKVPHRVNVKTAYNLLADELNNKKARITFGDDKSTMKLVTAESPDLDYTENNKVIPYDIFINRTLLEAGLLPVNPTTPAANGNGTGVTHRIVTAAAEGQRPPAELLAAIERM
jgi:hypothetical protein